MSIFLARIDDRLIHGQVTEGWSRVYKPDIIVVISDEVAKSDWEKELCLAALPPHVEGKVVTIDESIEIINTLLLDSRSSYVLFETPYDAYKAVKKGAGITSLNVGGMHSIKGKRKILDYIFVDENDSKYLKALQAEGITIDFRDLPEHETIDVMSKL